MLTRLVRPEDILLTEEDYRRLVGPSIRRMTVDQQLISAIRRGKLWTHVPAQTGANQ